MSASTLRELHVFAEGLQAGSTRWVELPTRSSRYRTVRDVFDRGIMILETARGRQALIEVGEKIIEGRWEDKDPCLYDRRDVRFTRLPYYIDRFLRQMRQTPPEVYLSSDLPGEAATLRWDWATSSSTMNDFIPGDAGNLSMHSMIIDDMVNSKNHDEYSTFLFQMAISVAHELGHFLTAYISGVGRPATPSTAHVAGLPPRQGEAGHYWEVAALGGIVEFYADRRARDTTQAGTPYIFNDLRPRSEGMVVSRSFIEGFRAGRFDLPVLGSSSARQTTRSEVRRSHEEMSYVRHRRLNRINAASSSAQGGSSSSVRNRQPGPAQYYPQPQAYQPQQGYTSASQSSTGRERTRWFH